MKKIGILLTVAAILVSMTVPSVLACTTRTPGYWKNHLEAWPTTGTITVGALPYGLSDSGDVDDLMDILWAKPKKGNAWIILAQKVIAAQLSMLVYPHNGWSELGNFGGYTDGMVGLVGNANIWLASHANPCLPGAMNRDTGLALAETMDHWLNEWNEHGLNG